MTQQPKRLFIAALLAATGAVAIAQTPPPAAPATGEAAAQRHAAPGERHARKDPAQRQQRMAEHHARRMADLKDQLKISPAQEGAWAAYADALQPAPLSQGPRMGRAEFGQLTTPQRIDHLQQRAAERQAHLQQRGEAVKAFYAQLTPEQQKLYDERALRGGRHGHRGHHRHGPQGGHGPR